MEEAASSQLSVEKCLAIFVWTTLAVIQYFNFWNDDTGSYEEVDEIGPDGKRVTRKRLKPRAARKKAPSYSRLRPGEKADIEQPDDEDQDQDSSGYGSEEGRPHRKPAKRRVERDVGVKPKDEEYPRPHLKDKKPQRSISSIRSPKSRSFSDATKEKPKTPDVEEKVPKTSLSFDTGTQVTAPHVDRGTTPHLPPKGEEKEIKATPPAALPPKAPEPTKADEAVQKPVTAAGKSELDAPVAAKPKQTKSAEELRKAGPLAPSAPKAPEKIPEPPRKPDAEKPKDTKTAAVQSPTTPALKPISDTKPKTVRSADEVGKTPPLPPRLPPPAVKPPAPAIKSEADTQTAPKSPAPEKKEEAPKPKETKPVATQAFPSPKSPVKPSVSEGGDKPKEAMVDKSKDTKPVATQAFPSPAPAKPITHDKAVEPKVVKPVAKAPVITKEAAPKGDAVQKPREVKSEGVRKPPPDFLPTRSPSGARRPRPSVEKQTKPPEKVDKAQSVPSTAHAHMPKREAPKPVDKHDVGQTTSDFRPKDISVTKEKPEIATPPTKAKAIGTDKDAGVHRPVDSKIPLPKIVPSTPTKVREPAQISSEPLPSTSKRATFAEPVTRTPDHKAPAKAPIKKHSPSEPPIKKPLDTKKTKPLGAEAAAAAAAATAPVRKTPPRSPAGDDHVAQKKKHPEEAKGKSAPQKPGIDEGISKISPKDTKDKQPKTVTTLMAPKPIDEQQSKEMTPVGIDKSKMPGKERPKGIRSEPSYKTPTKPFTPVLPPKADKKKETPSKIPVPKVREKKPLKSPAGDAEKEKKKALDEVQEEKTKRPRKRDMFDTESSDTDTGSADDWYLKHPQFGRKKSPKTASDADVPKRSRTPKEKKIKKDKEGKKLKEKPEVVSDSESAKPKVKTPKEKKPKKERKRAPSGSESPKPRGKSPKKKKVKKEGKGEPSDSEGDKPKVKIPKEKKIKKEDKGGASDSESAKKRPRSKEKKRKEGEDKDASDKEKGDIPKRRKPKKEEIEDIKSPKEHHPKKEKSKRPKEDYPIDIPRSAASEVEIEKTPLFKPRRGDETPSDILSIPSDDQWYQKHPEWKPKAFWKSPRKPSVELDEVPIPHVDVKSDFESPAGPSSEKPVRPPKEPRDRTPKRAKSPRTKSPKKKMHSRIPKKTPTETPSGSGDVQPEERKRRSPLRKSDKSDSEPKEKKPKEVIAPPHHKARSKSRGEEPTTPTEGGDRPPRERKPKEPKPEKAPKEIKEPKESPKRLKSAGQVYSDVQLDRAPKQKSPKEKKFDSDDDLGADSGDDWYLKRPKPFKGLKRGGDESPERPKTAAEPKEIKRVRRSPKPPSSKPKEPRKTEEIKEPPKPLRSRRHPHGDVGPKEPRKISESPKPLRSKSDVELDQKPKQKTPKEKKPTDSDDDFITDSDESWYEDQPKPWTRPRRIKLRDRDEETPTKDQVRRRLSEPREKTREPHEKKPKRKSKEPRKTEEIKEPPKHLRSRRHPHGDVPPKEPKEPRKISESPKLLRSKSDVELDDQKPKQKIPKEKKPTDSDDFITDSDESWYEDQPKPWTRPRRIKLRDRDEETPTKDHVRRRLSEPREKTREPHEKKPKTKPKEPRKTEEIKEPPKHLHSRRHPHGDVPPKEPKEPRKISESPKLLRSKSDVELDDQKPKQKTPKEKKPTDSDDFITDSDESWYEDQPKPWRRPRRIKLRDRDEETPTKDQVRRRLFDPSEKSPGEAGERIPRSDKSPREVKEKGKQEKPPFRPQRKEKGRIGGRTHPRRARGRSERSPSDTEGEKKSKRKRPLWRRRPTPRSDMSPSDTEGKGKDKERSEKSDPRLPFGDAPRTKSPSDVDEGPKERRVGRPVHPFGRRGRSVSDKSPSDKSPSDTESRGRPGRHLWRKAPSESDRSPSYGRGKSTESPTDTEGGRKPHERHPFWKPKKADEERKPRTRSKSVTLPTDKKSDRKHPFLGDRRSGDRSKKPRARSRSARSPSDTESKGKPDHKRPFWDRDKSPVDKKPHARYKRSLLTRISDKIDKPPKKHIPKDEKPKRPKKHPAVERPRSVAALEVEDEKGKKTPRKPRRRNEPPSDTLSGESDGYDEKAEDDKWYQERPNWSPRALRRSPRKPDEEDTRPHPDVRSPQGRRPDDKPPPTGGRRYKRSPERDESTESPSGDKPGSRPERGRKPLTRGGPRTESPSETESKETPHRRRPFWGRTDESSTDAERGRKPHGRSKSPQSPSETEDSRRSRTPRARSKSAESPSDTEGRGKPHPEHRGHKSPGERHRWKPRARRSEKSPSDREGKKPHTRGRGGPHDERRHPFWPRGRSRSEQSPSDTEGGRKDTKVHSPSNRGRSTSEYSPTDTDRDERRPVAKPQHRVRQRSTVTSDSQSQERRPKETHMPKEGADVKERKRRPPRSKSRGRKPEGEHGEGKRAKEKKEKDPRKRKRRVDERSWSRPRTPRKDEAEDEKKPRRRKPKGTWPALLDYTSLSEDDSYNPEAEDAALLTPNRALQKMEDATTQWRHRMEEDPDHRKRPPG